MLTRFLGTVRGSILPVLATLAAIVLFIMPGCGNGGGDETVLKVFAAASLTDAFQDIALEFESENPGVDVKLNFAGSQRLRSQLELGADADVFAFADEIQMSLAEDAGLVSGDSLPFAGASMAVIVSSDVKFNDISGIADPDVKLVLAHGSVPAGQYARELLARLSEAVPATGPDFFQRALANVVSEETSVKFVEQKVVLGQADAGIVYRPGALTATATGSARELPLPPVAEGVRAIYPIAVARESRAPELAERFVEFVLSGPAQDILTVYGFDTP